ncbi:crotonase/enoyl-CoA hydratase family protein [Dyadobacter luteus]|uniref:Crotonase/enoyl-CoA hydratase family protein n=1 Tax=Dyadobacter luteus TaxID=2259619 RepID=A0A3D8Y575_9BACT|nr:crotonase/enoyl-CoA hydratase family protein [Dyadobacter luteus]REA57552.1 crotonase/enoyl-CoA hydratase family protein [Dyadobacter luteus]
MKYAYKTLRVNTETPYIASISFNRPEKANALHMEAWEELKEIFINLSEDDAIRVVILSGEGKHFCSGIDLSLLQELTQSSSIQGGHQNELLRKKIVALQTAVTSIENCNKPVIAAISGGCIGAGLDIATACDMRYASEDAYFSIREIDMGMVADLGTLQRLPKIISEGLVRELAYTGRNVPAEEAEKTGLVNKVYSDKDELTTAVHSIAKAIAEKSPLAIRGTKHILNYSRDHSVADGLNYVATWNAATLLSADLKEIFVSKQKGRSPKFNS